MGAGGEKQSACERRDNDADAPPPCRVRRRGGGGVPPIPGSPPHAGGPPGKLRSAGRGGMLLPQPPRCEDPLEAGAVAGGSQSPGTLPPSPSRGKSQLATRVMSAGLCTRVYVCVCVNFPCETRHPHPNHPFPPHYTIMFTTIERAVPFFDFLPSEMCCIRTFLLHLNRKFICHSNLPGGDIFVASHQCTPHECEHILCPACLPASSR